jgi:UDP-N-acetylmuramoyl-tripeptide--D-alanyl-D-alanine ligase
MESYFSVREILAPLSGKIIFGNPEAHFNTYCIDSRFVSEGMLFVPLLGQQRDGHQFILDAVFRGATISLVRSGHHLIDEVVRVLNDSKGFVSAKFTHEITLVDVRHTLVALQKLASWYRRRFDSAKIIGITGSVGKTQTKEMLLALLRNGLRIVGTDRNFNNEIGVPLTLSKLREDTEYAIVEMAMRGRGEISLLSRIAQPDLGLVTNTLGSHVGRLGSGIEVARAKAEIVDGMKAGSKLWLNLRDRYLPVRHAELEEKQAIKRGLRVAYFDASAAKPQTYLAPLIAPGADEALAGDTSAKATATIWLSDVVMRGLDGSKMMLCTPKGSVPVDLAVPGRGAVENFLCAAALALDMGAELGDISKYSADIRPTPQRLVPYELKGKTILIDDTYNSSPASTHDALEVLSQLPADTKRILVLGDMLELGKYETLMHKQVAAQIYKLPPSLVIGIGPRMAALRDVPVPAGFELAWFHGISDEDEKIAQGFPPSTDTHDNVQPMPEMVDDRTIERITARLLEEIKSTRKPLVILIKGSRALHLERLVNGLMSYFGKEAKVL